MIPTLASMNQFHMFFEKDSTYQAAWFSFYNNMDLYVQKIFLMKTLVLFFWVLK